MKRKRIEQMTKRLINQALADPTRFQREHAAAIAHAQAQLIERPAANERRSH